MKLINEHTIELRSWFTNPDITSKIVTSSINISETISISHDYHNYGDSLFDDCGNASESIRSVSNYYFNLFPFSISTELFKRGEVNGFKFILSYNDYKATYNFHEQRSSTGNTIEILDNYNLNNQNFNEIFKINFGETEAPTEIKTIFYAKEFGIVFIELNNGITLHLD